MLFSHQLCCSQAAARLPSAPINAGLAGCQAPVHSHEWCLLPALMGSGVPGTSLGSCVPPAGVRPRCGLVLLHPGGLCRFEQRCGQCRPWCLGSWMGLCQALSCPALPLPCAGASPKQGWITASLWLRGSCCVSDFAKLLIHCL